MHTKAGFTLLELLLSLALIGLVFSFSIPVYQTFQVTTDLGLFTNTVEQSLRQAQTYAWAVEGDSDWGVHVASGTLTLFKGTSYVSRDASYDETFTVASTITPSGLTEVVFVKWTGAPSATGTLSLTSTNGESSTLTINAKGLVD